MLAYIKAKQENQSTQISQPNCSFNKFVKMFDILLFL